MIFQHRLLLIASLLAAQGLYAGEIQDAVKQGDVAKVKSLAEADPKLLQSEPGSWTLLHEAARNGRKEVAEFLIASKVNIDAKDKDAWTPLHVAAQWGQKDMVKLLLDKDARVNAHAKDGTTPLHVACSMLQTEVAALLIAARADVSGKDDSGKIALFHAVQPDQKSITDLGVKPGNQKELVVMLLKKSNPSTMDASGKSLLKVAEEAGLTEILALLKQAGGKEEEIPPPAQ